MSSNELSVVEFKQQKKLMNAECRKYFLEYDQARKRGGLNQLEEYFNECQAIYKMHIHRDQCNIKSVESLAAVLELSRSEITRRMRVAAECTPAEIKSLLRVVSAKGKPITKTHVEHLTLLSKETGDRQRALELWKESDFSADRFLDYVQGVKDEDQEPSDSGSGEIDGSGAASRTTVMSLPRFIKKGLKSIKAVAAFLTELESIDLDGVVDEALQSLMADLLLQQKTVSDLAVKMEAKLDPFVASGTVLDQAPAIEAPKKRGRKKKIEADGGEPLDTSVAVLETESADAAADLDTDAFLDSLIADVGGSKDSSEPVTDDELDELLGVSSSRASEPDEIDEMFGNLAVPEEQDAAASSVAEAVASRSLKRVSRKKNTTSPQPVAGEKKRRGRPPGAKAKKAAVVDAPAELVVAGVTGPEKFQKRK